MPSGRRDDNPEPLAHDRECRTKDIRKGNQERNGLAIGGINILPQRLATVVFHYSQTQDYKP